MTWPPVRMAISCNMAFLRSPKPGALTAAIFNPPRSLFTTKVANASPSTSSAMIRRGLVVWMTDSSNGTMGCSEDSFFSCRRIYASSRSEVILSPLVTKYGERYPRSNCIPSTTSVSVSRPLFSSTVMTPSLPTFCMASAIWEPISVSPLAEIVPTWATSAESTTGRELSLIFEMTCSTAWSTPLLRSIGFMPAATDFSPSRTIDCAKTVAVVVPSPASSLVLDATSLTIWAPMFSNLSSSSTSLATVTPSLVMRGAPNDLSNTTLRPFGPNVILTASARVLIPLSMRLRASVSNRTSLAAIYNSP